MPGAWLAGVHARACGRVRPLAGMMGAFGPLPPTRTRNACERQRDGVVATLRAVRVLDFLCGALLGSSSSRAGVPALAVSIVSLELDRARALTLKIFLFFSFFLGFFCCSLARLAWLWR